MWRETIFKDVELGQEFIMPDMLDYITLDGVQIKMIKYSKDEAWLPNIDHYVIRKFDQLQRVLIEVTEAFDRLDKNAKGATDAIKKVIKSITKDCSDCKGTGKYYGLIEVKDCSRCGGKGRVICESEDYRK